MPKKNYQNEKEKLLQMLSENEREIIKKNYPFKKIRNEKINELMQKGVNGYALAELTNGLCRQSVYRISNGGRSARILTKSLQNQMDVMNQVAETVDVFYKQIKILLNQRRK
jgi:hypothetical protein